MEVTGRLEAGKYGLFPAFHFTTISRNARGKSPRRFEECYGILESNSSSTLKVVERMRS
jgi:hypothetical protein